MIDAAPEAAARSQPSAERAAENLSWPALGRLLLADIAAVARERLHLAALEGQQFVHAAGRLLAFGVAAAILVLTAWFVVVAAAVVLLARLGMPVALALLIGAVLNLIAAVWAWLSMRRQLSSMSFAATLRSLQFVGPSAPAGGAASNGAEALGADSQPKGRATAPASEGADRSAARL